MLADLIKVVLTPLCLAILCLLAACLIKCRMVVIIRTLTWIALFALVSFSLPVVANALLFSLESRYPPTRLSDVPDANVITVMGGGTSHNGRRAALARGGDRLLLTFLLSQQNPTAEIWLAHAAESKTDDINAPGTPSDILMAWGIPEDRIRVLPPRSNTQSEIELMVEQFRPLSARTMIVVTSATHMQRVEAQFRHAGVNIVPAAANHWITPAHLALSYLDFLPSAISLGGSTRALNEYLAYAYCRIRQKC